jgi:hypothetical protein
MAGPFSWRRVAASRVDCWSTTSHADYFEGRHDGFSVPEPGATHTRRVLFLKDGYWIVRDDVAGTGTYEASATLQCAVGLTVAASPAGGLQVADDGGHAVASLWTFGEGVEPVIEDGWVSTGYASREAAPRVRAVCRGTGPLSIVCVVADPGLGLEVVEGEGRHLEIALAGAWRDTVSLGDATLSPDAVASDGHIVWARRDARTGLLAAALAVGATYVDVDGGRLSAVGGRGTLLAVRGPAGWRIERGAPAATTVAAPASTPAPASGTPSERATAGATFAGPRASTTRPA